MTSLTRFAYCSWTTNAGNPTDVWRHVGLIFSRMTPWEYTDLVPIVENQAQIQEFLRYPEHPYFIIPCPPSDRLREHHPLVRKPVGWDNNLLERAGALTTDDWLNTPSQEHRYIVTPSVDTVLSRELHDSTLEYQFILAHRGTTYAFTYKDLWKRCPLVQGMFHSYRGCPACDIRGVECVKTWLGHLLAERRIPLRLENLQYSGKSSYTPRNRNPSYYAVPYDWNCEFKDLFSSVDRETIVLNPPTKQETLPGLSAPPPTRTYEVQYVSRGLCREPRTSPFLKTSDYTPRQTTLNPEDIQVHKDAYQRSAAKSAATRKKHNTVCGTAENECFLRCEGCTRWRSSSPCTRRWSDSPEMLEAGVSAFKRQVEYQERDFVVAFSLRRNRRFLCVNPNTGRVFYIRYGGLRFDSGVAEHVLVRSARGETYELFRGAWRGLLQFLRRWAPWHQAVIASAADTDITIKDPDKVFYAECANVSWYQSSGGSWGGNFHETVAVYGSNPLGSVSISVITSGNAHWFSSPEDLAKSRGWGPWFKWIPA